MKVTANNRRKIKENEKIDKYLDLAREQKKLWSMKVTADHRRKIKENEKIDEYLDLAREQRKKSCGA